MAGRQEGAAGEQPAGADRLAQGQSRQGDGRHHRRRQPEPCRRAFISETHRHANPARALSRRGAGDDRICSPARSICAWAPKRRRCCLICSAARSRPSRSWTRRAGRRRPRFRPSTRPACPGWHCRSGTRCGCRRRTPKDIVAKLNAAAVDALADAGRAPAPRRSRPGDLRRASSRRRQALGAFHKAEIDKWWPIIKAAGIKPE